MGINLELYRKASTSKDRVFTDKCDVNGRKINVGDVIVPVGSTEQYCVNYSPTGRCFYFGTLLWWHRSYRRTFIEL